METIVISLGGSVIAPNKVNTSFLKKFKNRYLLRVDNLEQLIEELKKDALRTIEDLKQVASEIDKVLGL